MRDRLIELLKEKQDYGVIFKESQMDDRVNYRTLIDNISIADYLIDNGVIVPPCRVGGTVYVNTTCDNIRMHKDDDYFSGTGEEICPFEYCCGLLDCYNSICGGQVSTFETTVKQILIDDTGIHIFVEDFDLDITIGDFCKTVFLTREEAEKALKKQERKGK